MTVFRSQPNLRTYGVSLSRPVPSLKDRSMVSSCRGTAFGSVWDPHHPKEGTGFGRYKFQLPLDEPALTNASLEFGSIYGVKTLLDSRYH